MTAPVVRLSICQCGFPLFNNNVKLGDVYELDRAMTVPNCHVNCGGCGLDIPSTFIWADTKGDADEGYMPMEVFDL